MTHSWTIAALLVLSGPALAQTGEQKKTDFDITLEQAYKKEFAFLVGQQRQLEKRLKDIHERHVQEQRRVQNEMASLENRVISVDSQLQAAQMTLREAERSAESSSDDRQLIRATLERAATSLEDYDVTIAIPTDDTLLAQETVEVFEAATGVLSKLSSVQRLEGQDFFLADGRKVTGTVLHLGRIASYGVSDQGSGALAPVGGGKLKIWSEDAASNAQALVNRETPKTLDIFLYESIDSAVETDVSQSLIEHIAAGGAIAWVIVVLGIIGAVLAATRAVILFTCSGSTEELEKNLGPHARTRDVDRVLSKARSLPGSAARVTASVFRSVQDGTDRLDEAISEGLIAEARRVQLFGTAILVIAAVSPLLGLLGTVTGMISTFDVITKFGTGDPKMLSGGISTALITTELGLIVAIPTLLLGNLLKGWADRIESEAERAAIRMVTLYTGQPLDLPGRGSKSSSVELSAPLAAAE